MTHHVTRPLLRLPIALFGLLLSGSASLPAATLLFDFGATNTQTVSPTGVLHWNNITTTIGQDNAGALLNVVTTENVVTEIDFQMVARFNGANGNGSTSTTNSPFPATATQDSLYGNTVTFGGLSNVVPVFKLASLDPLLTYDLTFFASRVNAGGDNRESLYTVTGAFTGSVALNASENISNTVTLAGMVPNAAGEISVTLTAGPNNTNANKFAYLNVMKVDIIPEPGSASLLLGGLGVFAGLPLRRRS